MASVFLLILAIFATVVLAIYAVTPQKYRYLVLLLASIAAIFVYSNGMGAFVLLAAVSVYIGGWGMEKVELKYAPALKELAKAERKKRRRIIQRKKYAILAAVIVFNLAILLVLKYGNFLLAAGAGLLRCFGVEATPKAFKILLPIGISYYTLQAIGYLIDVARGKYAAARNPLKIALFICYFPQLLEGPIGRYDEMQADLTGGAKISGENVWRGWFKCLYGLFKVLVVSNRFGMIAGEVFKNHTAYGGLTVIFGVVAFTIQLYAEFSGYIDIAAGVSKMFGIGLKKNFDAPFLAASVPDFWRRWHISLGSWFRDYVFYPITMSRTALKAQAKETVGGKLAAKVILFFALLCVWALTGLWHGASVLYLLYGLYYFVLMLLYEALMPLIVRLGRALKIKHTAPFKILGVAFTFLLVNIGMLLFRAASPSAFAEMFLSIFRGGAASLDLWAVIDVKDFTVMLAGLAVMIVCGFLQAKKIAVYDRLASLPYGAKYAIFLVGALVIVIFGAYGMGYLPPDPIYGGF